MILIGDDYKIDADKHQYILHTRTVTTHEKAKSPYVWNQTYHASIKQCCAAITDIQAKVAVEKNLVNEFLPSIDRLCLAVSQAQERG